MKIIAINKYFPNKPKSSIVIDSCPICYCIKGKEEKVCQGCLRYLSVFNGEVTLTLLSEWGNPSTWKLNSEKFFDSNGDTVNLPVKDKLLKAQKHQKGFTLAMLARAIGIDSSLILPN